MRLSSHGSLIGFGVILLMCAVLMQPGAAQGSLLAFYQFEGNANDSSPNHKDGTVYGATLTTGYEGQAYAYDGTDYIYAPVNINPGPYPKLTMGAWAKATSVAAVRQVISHDDGGYDRSLGIDNRGGGLGWSAFSGTGAVLGYKTVTTDLWTFLAVVYDQTAATVKLYVDNQVVSETGSLGSGWNYIRIGSNPSYGEYFIGAIDNVFIFDQALTQAQLDYIRTHGASAIPLPSTVLLLSSGILGLGLLGARRKFKKD